MRAAILVTFGRYKSIVTWTRLMLFFTRAFLCIGTIVVLAEGLGPAEMWTKSQEAAAHAARSATAPLTSLCRARPADCVAVMSKAAALAARDPVSAPVPQSFPDPAAVRRRGTDLSLRPPLPK